MARDSYNGVMYEYNVSTAKMEEANASCKKLDSVKDFCDSLTPSFDMLVGAIPLDSNGNIDALGDSVEKGLEKIEQSIKTSKNKIDGIEYKIKARAEKLDNQVTEQNKNNAIAKIKREQAGEQE